MEITEIAKTISDLGLTVASIVVVVVLWKENKEERKKRDDQAVKLQESFIKMENVITNNTSVLERVDNFIRSERGDL